MEQLVKELKKLQRIAIGAMILSGIALAYSLYGMWEYYAG